MYLIVRLIITPQGNLTTKNLGFQPLISGGGGSTSSYRVNYNKSEYEKLLETPLTFEITSAGNIGFYFSSDYSEYVSGFTIEYKKNSGEWTEANVTTDIYSISVLSGDTVQFRGNNSTYCINYDDDISFEFSPTDCNFKLNGNIMSLLNKDNFASLDALQSAYTFFYLFYGCTGLTDASKLVLPATTLADDCYSGLFYGCSSLTNAPVLPATILAYFCYESMFGGCTSLTAAPALPATTLTECCYYQMFQDCTSLTTAPALPATTLADECYANMFENCTSLTEAPELPATTLANGCYNNMFYNCTSLTAAPELPATTLANYCYEYMFRNCSRLTTAHELPATTLANGCYNSMFGNTNVLPDCSNIDFTSATVVASGGLRGLFSGTKVTDNDLRQILPINPNTNNYYLPVTTLADYCYQDMFRECTSLTTAPELPATTLANGCYIRMFANCTKLTTAPELPATTLVSSCYQNMFLNCSSLNYIKAMFTTTPDSSYTSSWVSGVASTGTFVKNSAASWNVTGAYGVPTGWTVQTATS